MRIVFMGSPDFAVETLKKLIEFQFNVVGIITATDKIGGRGKNKVIETPVKAFARTLNIPILQPKTLKGPRFLRKLSNLKADIQVVVAFRMLPEVVWNMPSLGTINLHASLLPKYRGAAPIHWAVINGETETGLTTFRLKHAIDTGDILLQEKVQIRIDDTTGSLYNRMKAIGADLVLQTLRAIKSDSVTAIPQSNEVSKAPKIYHKDAQIQFDQTSLQVYNFIRGMSPFPCAWTELDDQTFKIYFANIYDQQAIAQPGKIQTDHKTYLRIATQDGWIACKDVQMSGKRRMDIKTFLNGYRIQSLAIGIGPV